MLFTSPMTSMHVYIWGSMSSRDPSIHHNCSGFECEWRNTSRCDPYKHYFLRLGESLAIHPELCLSKWFKSQAICLIRISSSIVCSLLSGTHIIRDRKISCSRYRKATLLYANATVVWKCVCNESFGDFHSFVTVLNTKPFFWALQLDIQCSCKSTYTFIILCVITRMIHSYFYGLWKQFMSSKAVCCSSEKSLHFLFIFLCQFLTKAMVAEKIPILTIQSNHILI